MLSCLLFFFLILLLVEDGTSTWMFSAGSGICRSECLKKADETKYQCAYTLNPGLFRGYKDVCDPLSGLNSGKPVLSKSGYFCASECGNHGYSYDWCYLYSSWDYCDPNNSPVKQHITRWGEYCVGPCDKIGGTSYYWCRRGHASDSFDTWDYCSPGKCLCLQALNYGT
jgi:hypothetical protein